MRPLLALAAFALAGGCATSAQYAVSPGMPANEVSARLGKPVAEARLADGGTYWDYRRDPYGYYRVTFGADGRVREMRNLLTEQNFGNLRAGMTQSEVEAIVGVPADRLKEAHANGTRSWTYRYYDAGIAKLLHVIFDPAERVQWYYAEWDRSRYSGDDDPADGDR